MENNLSSYLKDVAVVLKFKREEIMLHVTGQNIAASFQNTIDPCISFSNYDSNHEIPNIKR